MRVSIALVVVCGLFTGLTVYASVTSMKPDTVCHLFRVLPDPPPPPPQNIEQFYDCEGTCSGDARCDIAYWNVPPSPWYAWNCWCGEGVPAHYCKGSVESIRNADGTLSFSGPECVQVACSNGCNVTGSSTRPVCDCP